MSPASSSLGFAGEDGRRTAIATDRCEALRVQRVDDDVVLFDVSVQVIVVKFGQWVDADGVCFDVDREDWADGSFAAVAASETADKRVVLIAEGVRPYECDSIVPGLLMSDRARHVFRSALPSSAQDAG